MGKATDADGFKVV